MKKIFTLLSAAVLGIAGAYAQTNYTWNFEFKGDGLSDIYKGFTATAQAGANQSESIDLQSDSFTYASNETSVEITLSSTSYTVTSVTCDNSDITLTSSDGSWSFKVNPGYTQTIEINVEQGKVDVPSTTTYVPVVINEPTAVASITYNTEALVATSVTGTWNIEVTDRTQNYGNLVITLVDGSKFDTATAVYTLKTPDDPENNSVSVNAVYTAATDDAAASFLVSNIDIENANTVIINLSEYVEPPVTEATVTFVLNGYPTTADDLYENVLVTVNSEAKTLDSNSFEVTYDIISDDAESQSVIITPAEGYVISNYRAADDASIMFMPLADGSLGVELYVSAANNGQTIDITVQKLGPSVPVTLDVTDYPGLVESYTWNGLNTALAEGVESFDIQFYDEQEDGTLYFFFGKNEDGDLLYDVAMVEATALASNGAVTVYRGTISDDGSDAYVYIPATATVVEVSFTMDTTGVEALNVANGENVIYNLQGVRVNNVGKGLYIINGKKVLVK